MCFLNESVIQISPRSDFRFQAHLKVSAISFHPKCPCRPHWPAKSYVVRNMKEAVNREGAHCKAGRAILIIDPMTK